ncbi:MAG: T9SS type A sorting domain-containing protein [candidate division Zixibacteria bacterium]|nr:T9SS type A sorting domain-containing protein [candidate division Zixibacteria bacterium]
MTKKLILMACLLALLTPVSIFAEGLFSGPESVAFDSIRNRYLVSNYYNGKIVAVDADGNHSYFKEGFAHCFGNHIYGDILYVSADNQLVGLSLETADTVFSIAIPANNNLDGNTHDDDGYIYVVDTGGGIFKVDPVNHSYSIFVGSGLSNYPQDIVFDRFNNRLVLACYTTRAPILTIDISDSTVSEPFNYFPGNLDGISIDAEGNFYISSHQGGGIWKIDNTLEGDPELISTGHNEPAGLDVNFRDNILAVPNFRGHTMDLIPLGSSGVEDSPEPGPPSRVILHGNYPNPFNASTVIEYQLPVESNLEINVYDILGRKVDNIFKGTSGKGTYSVTWDASNYPSGVYYYRLTADDGFKTGRMLLLR